MSNKSLFNFYLDDNDKQNAIDKLERLAGGKSKGQFASFLRVVVKLFNATPDEKVNKDLIEAINAEYIYSATSNKRSRL